MKKTEELTMCRVFKLEIIESKEELEEQIKKEKDVRKRERMQFLYWYKIGQATTRKALAKLLCRSQFAIGQWSEIYRETRKGLLACLTLTIVVAIWLPPYRWKFNGKLKKNWPNPRVFSVIKPSNFGSRKRMV